MYEKIFRSDKQGQFSSYSLKEKKKQENITILKTYTP